MATQTWPGNVRELRNAVARTLSLGGASPTAAHAQLAESPSTGAIKLDVPLKEGRDRVADEYERAYLRAALHSTGGNVTHAAELAGVNRKFIQRAMKKYALTTDE